MFFDERIHIGRGKAFRKTMILATIVYSFDILFPVLRDIVLQMAGG